MNDGNRNNPNFNDPNSSLGRPSRQPWDFQRKRQLASVLFFVGTMLAIIFRFGFNRD